MLAIATRKRKSVGTDPRYSSEWVWTDWEVLEHIVEERAAKRLEFWRELNAYAVSCRGEKACKEFKTVEIA